MQVNPEGLMRRIQCRLCHEHRPSNCFPKLKGVLYERCLSCLKSIPKVLVFARDRGICALCEHPVDFSEASIDHIIPVSQWDWGAAPRGPHTLTNVQLSHARCNIRKGGRMPGDIKKVFGTNGTSPVSGMA